MSKKEDPGLCLRLDCPLAYIASLENIKGIDPELYKLLREQHIDEIDAGINENDIEMHEEDLMFQHSKVA